MWTDCWCQRRPLLNGQTFGLLTVGKQTTDTHHFLPLPATSCHLLPLWGNPDGVKNESVNWRNSAPNVNDPSLECLSWRRARRGKDTSLTPEMNSLLSSHVLAGCAGASGSSAAIRDNKAVASISPTKRRAALLHQGKQV